MGAGKVLQMRKMIRWRYMVTATIIATTFWIIAHKQPMPPTQVSLTQMEVRPVRCPQAWICTFDIVGEDKKILGQSVLVSIEGYAAPTWIGAWCWVEEQKGEKATAYLWELMRGAKTITLVDTRKEWGFPAIYGRLLLDGEDVAFKLIELGVASPLGVEVDWCEESPKEVEC